MRTLPVLLIGALALPLSAQLKVTAAEVGEAGVALDLADNSRVVKLLSQSTSTYSYYKQAYYYQYSTTDYLMGSTTLYTPYSSPYASYVYNNVGIYNSGYTRKGSKHKSIHTTNNTKGDPGTQKYKVTLSSQNATNVKIDYNAYGIIYDASTAAIKFTVNDSTLSQKTYNWSWTQNGYAYNNGSITIKVQGTTTIDVEVTAQCKPGTGSGQGSYASYYDGYNASLYFNFLEVNAGSFSTFGNACGGLKLSGSGTPARGSSYAVNLSGAKANTSVAILYGPSKDYYQFIKLPLSLDYMGAKGCTLYVGFSYPWYYKADSNGNASANVYLSPYYSGTYYVQWLQWDPQNPSGGLALSEAATIMF